MKTTTDAARVKEAASMVRALQTCGGKGLPGLPVLRLVALDLRLDLPRVLHAKDAKRLAATGLKKEYVAALLRAFPGHDEVGALDAATQLFMRGLPCRLVTSLVGKHGHRAAHVLADDPFGALWDLGASLAEADQCAMCATGAGVQTHRIMGHVAWHVRTAMKHGNTAIPRAYVVSKVHEATGLEEAAVQRVIDDSPAFVTVTTTTPQSSQAAQLVDAQTYAAEHAIATQVKARAADKVWEDDLVERLLNNASSVAAAAELSEDQRAAVRTVCGAALSVLTGGPGTGKSSMVRYLVDVIGTEGCLLTAPTGRAARNVNGSTVHSASGGRLARRPLQETTRADVRQDLKLLVVDEASMLTTELMTAVLALAPPGCHIVLVGDPDQLPPIGAGNVLCDLLSSRACPVATLTTNHRSLSEVHRLGRAVLEGDASRVTAALTQCPTSAAAMRAVVGLVTAAPDEAQVLVPHNATRSMYNRALQSALLPGGVKVAMKAAGWGVPVGRIGRLVTDGSGRSTLTFATEADQPKVIEADVDGALTLTKSLSKEEGVDHLVVGDAVMVLKNQNKRRVAHGEVSACNGDIGVLRRAPGGLAAATPLVEFEGGTSEFPKAAGWLTLGYAATVHKFQGSECEHVVLPLDGTWDRTLLYTAVTRAKSRVTLLGTPAQLRSILDKKRPRRQGALAAILDHT